MRIIITKKGKTIIQEIENNNSSLNNSSNANDLPFLQRYYSTGHYKRIRKSVINKNFQTLKYNNLSNNIHFLSSSKNNNCSFSKITNNTAKTYRKNDINNSYDIDENNFSTIKNPKYIKLHHRKLIFPKFFSDKYEKDSKDSTNIIDSNMNSYIPSKSLKNLNISEFSDKKYYSFSDVIPKKNIIEMKKKIIEDYKNKEKYTRIDENHFRSVYHSKINLDKFNNLLFSPKIKSTKLSLIKYLNEKNIEPKALTILYKKNLAKLNKLNQMCKLYFINKERVKIFNDNIKKKVNDKSNNVKNIFQIAMRDAEIKVDNFKYKLQKYRCKINEREKYKDIFFNIKNKYWDRYDFDRYNKKKGLNKRNSFLNKSQNSEIINNKYK